MVETMTGAFWLLLSLGWFNVEGIRPVSMEGQNTVPPGEPSAASKLKHRAQGSPTKSACQSESRPGAIESLGPTPKAPVQRIASLAPSLTQTVVFLGAKDKLVAVSRFDEEASLQHLPRAGGFSDVAVETLLRLRPDVVLAQKAPGNEAAIRRLAAQGIFILAFSLTTTKDVCQAMERLGELLEARDKAQQWLSSFENLRRQLREAAPKRRPKVLLLVGLSPTIAAGPGSFADELIWEAGGQNIVARSPTPFPVVSLERVVRQKPDIVIDVAEIHEGKSPLQKLPGLREARWIRAPNKDLLQPGPALLSALHQLSSWLSEGSFCPLADEASGSAQVTHSSALPSQNPHLQPPEGKNPPSEPLMTAEGSFRLPPAA